MRVLTPQEIQAVSGSATAPTSNFSAGVADFFSGLGKFFIGAGTIFYLLLTGRGIGDLY